MSVTVEATMNKNMVRFRGNVYSAFKSFVEATKGLDGWTGNCIAAGITSLWRNFVPLFFARLF